MTPEQLKASIFQYAIQGKLVEQKSEEGNAKELYKKIQEEKQKLIKEEKIKKEKSLKNISEDEIPFDIPESWKWVRIGDICKIINGFTPKRTNPEYWSNGTIPWFTIEDVRKQGRFIEKTEQFITEKALSKGSERIVPANTVLLCCTASVGEYAYTRIPLTTNQQFNALVVKNYYSEFVSSMYIYEFVQTLKRQLVSNSGKTTFNFLSVGKLSEMLIPIPPYKEQNRIVKKIEELLPNVEQYGKAYEELEQFNNKFPEDLKKSILQYAVQGKLVEQREDDEPASFLLERILKEKKRLIDEGLIKRDNNYSTIYKKGNSYFEKRDNVDRCIDEEIPFTIPQNWSWARAYSLGTMVRGKGIKRVDVIENGKPCVRYGEIYTSYDYSFKNTKSYITDELFEKCVCFSENDVIFTLTGKNKTDIAKTVAYLGKNKVAAGGDLAFWTYHGMNPLYLAFCMASPYCIEKKRELATGDIIVHISTSKVGSLLIPIPPLEEQLRIVDKVEELMIYCEQLY